MKMKKWMPGLFIYGLTGLRVILQLAITEENTFVNELKALSIILNWYRHFINEDFNIPITKKHRQLCYYKMIPPKRPDYYARPAELKKWIQWLKENRQNPVRG